jgi:hypothetical protein
MMVLAFFLILFTPPTFSPAMFTPVQKYIALGSQKIMLFEYGLPFKLHKRSRTELYKAALGHLVSQVGLPY